MSITVERLGDTGLELGIHGKIDKADLAEFAPRAEACIEERGKVDLLIDVSDFEGYTPAGLWNDLKFDVRRYSDVSRLALVAEDRDKQWMATLSKPFTAADVKFYPRDEIEAARRWICGGVG
jgi:hypothetical protein